MQSCNNMLGWQDGRIERWTTFSMVGYSPKFRGCLLTEPFLALVVVLLALSIKTWAEMHLIQSLDVSPPLRYIATPSK
jgi:hypothetical protein